MSKYPRQQHPSIAITSADYFFSHELARYLLEQHGQAFERIVLTVRDPKRVEDIGKHPNLEVKVIDGQDRNKIVEALKNLDWVILVPQPENNQVQYTNQIIEAAQQAGVKNALMHSVAAAETPQGCLQEFTQIEQKLQQTGHNWTIFRHQFVQNWFHLWSPVVQDRNEFPITFELERKFVPVMLQDITRATYEVVSKKEVGKHKGLTYTLTGPEKLSAKDFEKKMNTGLDVEPENAIKIKKVQRAELEKYLKELRDSSNRRGRLGKKLEGQPTDKQIQIILDMFDWVNSGQGEMQTDHLRQLTGKNGVTIERFFKDNQAEFRGDEGRDEEEEEEEDV